MCMRVSFIIAAAAFDNIGFVVGNDSDLYNSIHAMPCHAGMCVCTVHIVCTHVHIKYAKNIIVHLIALYAIIGLLTSVSAF